MRATVEVTISADETQARELLDALVSLTRGVVAVTARPTVTQTNGTPTAAQEPAKS